MYSMERRLFLPCFSAKADDGETVLVVFIITKFSACIKHCLFKKAGWAYKGRTDVGVHIITSSGGNNNTG